MISVLPPDLPPRYDVPLYSQIRDISSIEWQKKGCGVANIAMLIEYYRPNTTTVQKVLEEALASGAYLKDVGWKHAELAAVVKKYNLVGKTYDFSSSNREDAFRQFKDVLREGPVIASIHRDFNPKSPFGHLIVVTGFDGGIIHFNDPGKREGFRQVSVADFQKGWKKRLIVVRLPESEAKVHIQTAKETETKKEAGSEIAEADIVLLKSKLLQLLRAS